MKKIHLMLVLLFAFAVVTCTSGVVSAIYINPMYVGNTMVDLSWTEYESTDFSKYELYRDGSLIETIKDPTTTLIQG
jgi:capsular polysaccharide biosynthesis protein